VSVEYTTCSALPLHDVEHLQQNLLLNLQDVALQVAFERQTLKPVFHLIGYRLWV
jgi:hypothetical protein